VVVVLGLLGLLVFGLNQAARRSAGVVIQNSFGEVKVERRQATNFQLRLFDGGSLELADLRGKVVLLDFWATWCPPCRSEAPTLERVWKEYRDRGVVFVGINVFDDENDARSFIREFGITYPNGPDPGRLAVEYGVVGLPEKYLIDQDGRIVRKFAGPMRRETLTLFLDELLAGPAASP